MDFSDEELLEKYRNDDTRHLAFNYLVRKYQQRLYWHIRRIVIDHEDTNDILQNVFLKVWKSLDRFRADSALYTWLYRIATNEAISFLNQKRRRFFLPIADVEKQLSEQLASDPLFSGDQVQLRLQQAILQLPARQRLVFHMKYYDNMKYEEIAQVLEVSVGALKASYHHAVKKIEKILTGN